MSGCKFGRRINMFHAECKVSGGDCMFCRPNSEQCRAEYCEGPDVTGKEHYYTVLFEAYNTYTELWDKHMYHLWAETPKDAIEYTRKYTEFKTRKIHVLPLLKVIDEYTKFSDNKGHSGIKYNNRIVIKGRYTAFSNGVDKEYFKLPKGINSITGIAITEKYILVQYKDENDKFQQSSLPITDDLKELL